MLLTVDEMGHFHLHCDMRYHPARVDTSLSENDPFEAMTISKTF